MIEKFDTLSASEFETLKKAISWITVLIAGADDKIDEQEKEWASKLTKIRGYANEHSLNDFYMEVGKDFENQLDSLMDSLPNEGARRTTILTERLAMLNDIMAKLDNKTGHELYNSYVSFAQHVAKASGGFLRFMSISKVEKELMALNMLSPIELEDEEE